LQRLTGFQWFDENMRPTDVITNTLPKCGQTMLCTLLVSIKRKGHLTKTLFDECPWIETIVPAEKGGVIVKPSIEEHKESIEILDNPRIFKQHVDWSEVATSTDAKIQAGVRYVTITRDIRDVPYSMFEHMTGMSDEMTSKLRGPAGNVFKLPDEFGAFFEWWLNGPSKLSSATVWRTITSVSIVFPARFIKQLWEHRNDNNVLVLQYEEVTKDKQAAITAIVKFLGCEFCLIARALLSRARHQGKCRRARTWLESSKATLSRKCARCLTCCSAKI
jgi:hypothetical protein